MITYNLYYKDKKINKKRLTSEELNHIFTNKPIKKYDSMNKKFIDIPIKDIIVHQCIKI